MADPAGRGQGKVETFFTTRVAFTSLENSVSKLAQGLNAIGNAFLAPTRYLFEGRTVTCMTVGEKTKLVGDKTSELAQSIIIGKVRGGPSTEKGSWGKTALTAIAKVGAGLVSIIGVPVGGLIKGLAMLSPELRKRCDQVAESLGHMKEDKTHLIEKMGTAIILIKQRDMEETIGFLHQVWRENQLGPLIEALCKEETAINPEDYFFLEQCLESLQKEIDDPKKAEDPISNELALVKLKAGSPTFDKEVLKNLVNAGDKIAISEYLFTLYKNNLLGLENLYGTILPKEKWYTKRKELVDEAGQVVSDLVLIQKYISSKDEKNLTAFFREKHLNETLDDFWNNAVAIGFEERGDLLFARNCVLLAKES